MHGYYLHYRDIESKDKLVAGSDQKVKSQIKAFNNAGLSCKFCFCPHPENTFGKVLSSLPGFSDQIKWPCIDSLSDADFIYIRRPRFISKDMLEFLADFRELCPNALTMMEIPTYPYDGEMKKPTVYLAYLKDKKHRWKLANYIDYIVTFSNDVEIFGVPTVQIINGIDLDAVSKRKPSIAKDKAIHVMCAAFFTKSHAIERFVEGLANYYNNSGKREIILHLAGEGIGLNKTKEIVKKNSLERNVVFEGVLDRVRLDVLYDSCTFATEALGLHRVGVDIASTLKSREYLAKGMPFMYSADIDVFKDRPNEFCWQVPGDESPIDIEEFLAFYDRLYSQHNEQEVIDSIRAYAEETVGMDKAMSGVIELIKQHCG